MTDKAFKFTDVILILNYLYNLSRITSLVNNTFLNWFINVPVKIRNPFPDYVK